MKKYIPLLLLLCLLAIAIPCLCEEGAHDGDLYTIEGEITSLDSIKRVIVVKWLQQDPIVGYQEIVLKVPEDLKISKGTDMIGFDEVNQFDRVTVQYRKYNSSELPEVVSMIVEDSV